ncbi:GVQW3 protein, partial [Acromyrmex charruanus]
VYRWYKMFSEGREDVNDEEHAGRPSTSTTDENIDEVKKIALANRRITVREVAEDLNMSIGLCHSIFTNDLGMRRVAAKFVLAKSNTLMMPQPPYSPDLAPCDFFLFPKLKRLMKGRRYATIEEIKTASKEELNKITKNDFLKCFEDWKKRWHKCNNTQDQDRNSRYNFHGNFRKCRLIRRHRFSSTDHCIRRMFGWRIAAICSRREHNRSRIRYHSSTNYKMIHAMVRHMSCNFSTQSTYRKTRVSNSNSSSDSVDNLELVAALHTAKKHIGQESSYPHYIKDLSRLIRSQITGNKNRIFLWYKLEIHAVEYGKQNDCAIRLPSENNKWLSETSSYIYQHYRVFSLAYYVRCLHNDSLCTYKFCRDILSKHSWAVSLKAKSENEASRRCAINLHTDREKKFYSNVQKLLKKRNINHYSTYSVMKASVVEQFNTLKNMWKQFNRDLPCLISNYNANIELLSCDFQQAFNHGLQYRIKITASAQYKVRDSVRVSKFKTVFDKGYTPNWSTEVFKIIKVQQTNPVTYLLEDSRGEPIAGGFYEYELDMHLVEKMLRKKGNEVRT